MTISITDDARARVLEVRGREHDPQGLTLWVEVVGTAANAYTYDMAFLRRDEIDPTDLVTEAGEIAIVVPQTSAAYLDGATIALDGQLGGGLVIDNPNTPSPDIPGLEQAVLEGTVEQRVRQVVDLYVNPAIAAHRGSCEVVGVESDAVLVRLGGGCTGCGMAAVTLRQGIEAAIRSSVPEIARVVDVTDHTSGTNPYYAAT
ncbi:MAG: NifU family protein [Gaiellales bacterium]|jgi:Fe/S biogenesis protein NfuA